MMKKKEKEKKNQHKIVCIEERQANRTDAINEKIFTLSFFMQKLDTICNVDVCLHPERCCKHVTPANHYEYINNTNNVL